MSTATYAVINTKEITDLAKLKPSGCVVLVYTALLSYCHGLKTHCFPSIKTISAKLGNSYTERAIQKSLKFLEDNGMIKRNHRRSKQRFHMVKRAVVQTAKKVFEALKGNENNCSSGKRTDGPYKKPREKSSFLRRKKKNQRVRFAAPEPIKPKTAAEALWERMILTSSSGLPDPSILSVEERELVKAARQQGGCLEWTVEAFPDRSLWVSVRR